MAIDLTSSFGPPLALTTVGRVLPTPTVGPLTGPFVPFSGDPIVPPLSSSATAIGPSATLGLILIGKAPTETLVGSAGNDVLLGGSGPSTLDGRFGDDLLDGSAGDDVLAGGPGADVFVFRAGDGDDVIIDFAPAGIVRNSPAALTFATDALQLRFGDGGFRTMLDLVDSPARTDDMLLLLRPADDHPIIHALPGETILEFANGDSIRLLGIADATLDDAFVL